MIVLIALGESLVAIGVGASDELDGGIVAAVVIGVAAVSAMWWTYFDVTFHAAGDRLERAPVGTLQNELARDAYSVAHFLMIAGVVLFALGLKKTVAHVTDPLRAVPGARSEPLTATAQVTAQVTANPEPRRVVAGRDGSWRGRQRIDVSAVPTSAAHAVTISSMRARVFSMFALVLARSGRTIALIFSLRMSHVSRTSVPPSTGSSS